ncbi:MAG: PKD domain-containing protein, partial [Caldilineaceae bacterium]|nr:PKD domain-containing protein [Caldilineaceae bacterium]
PTPTPVPPTPTPTPVPPTPTPTPVPPTPTPTPQLPIAVAGGPYSGDEGSPIRLDGTGSSSPAGTTLTYTWKVALPTSPCTIDDDKSPAPNITCADNGNFDIELTVDNGRASDSGTATVTVSNVAPSVGLIMAPVEPVAVNTPLDFTTVFTDPAVLDTHTALWSWGDGSTSAGTVSDRDVGPDSHTYTTPGIYTVALAVADDDGGVGTAQYQYIVVYAPDGGFVTGGGWINSPAGAYVAAPTLTGKATFGFVAKYRPGAKVPTGNAEFHFKAGDLSFHSNTLEWLVVAGHDKAKFKGVGAINGSGNYGFMLTVVDGAPDTFRIKIWNKDAGDGVVYDNKMGASDDSHDGTELGGGNIRVHRP